MNTLPKLAFLASHAGSNLQALLQACHSGKLRATPVLVISNNAHAGALRHARHAAIPAKHLSRRHCNNDPVQLDLAMRDTLRAAAADWVILAGYMRPVGPHTLQAWPRRILNIHPGKLPAFGGRGMYGDRVHSAVLASGADSTTVTVHYVDAQYDQGAIIAEKTIPVHARDTAETLSARVKRLEHSFYAEVIARVLEQSRDGLIAQQ